MAGGRKKQRTSSGSTWWLRGVRLVDDGPATPPIILGGLGKKFAASYLP